MVKEQIIVKEIVETVGDNINQYILEFDSSSLWDYTERKILVNNTFKKLVSIMAEYNNVEEKHILESAHELDEDIFMDVYIYMIKDYLEKGGESLLQRLILFCINLHYHCRINKELPIEALRKMYEEEVVSVKKNIFTKIKYKFNKSDKPFEVFVDKFTMSQFALLSGRKLEDEIKFYYDMEINEMIYE